MKSFPIIALFILSFCCNNLAAQHSTVTNLSLLAPSVIIEMAKPSLEEAINLNKENRSLKMESYFKGEEIRVRIDATQTGEADIYLYDTKGKRIALSSFDLVKGPQFVDINYPTQEKDLILQVFFNKQKYTSKVSR